MRATLVACVEGASRSEIAENLMDLAYEIENGTDDNMCLSQRWDYDLLECTMGNVHLNFSNDIKHTKLLTEER